MLKKYLLSFIFLFVISVNNFANFLDKSALVIIDMQPYFSEVNPAKSKNNNRSVVEQVIVKQLSAIEEARKHNLEVILIEYTEVGATDKRILNALKGYSKFTLLKKMQMDFLII